jgi:hypothetical protein
VRSPFRLRPVGRQPVEWLDAAVVVDEQSGATGAADEDGAVLRAGHERCLGKHFGAPGVAGDDRDRRQTAARRFARARVDEMVKRRAWARPGPRQPRARGDGAGGARACRWPRCRADPRRRPPTRDRLGIRPSRAGRRRGSPARRVLPRRRGRRRRGRPRSPARYRRGPARHPRGGVRCTGRGRVRFPRNPEPRLPVARDARPHARRPRTRGRSRRPQPPPAPSGRRARSSRATPPTASSTTAYVSGETTTGSGAAALARTTRSSAGTGSTWPPAAGAPWPRALPRQAARRAGGR